MFVCAYVLQKVAVPDISSLPLPLADSDAKQINTRQSSGYVWSFTYCILYYYCLLLFIIKYYCYYLLLLLLMK